MKDNLTNYQNVIIQGIYIMYYGPVGGETLDAGVVSSIPTSGIEIS